MSFAETFPYRQAKSTRVETGRWHLVLGEKQELLGKALGQWDPATPVHVTQTVRVDVAGIRQDCRLPDDAKLVLTPIWDSTGTRMRNSANITELSEDTVTTKMEVQIPGNVLASSLTLMVHICLAQSLPKRPLVAWRPGTILWESAHRLDLEGGGSRFPMEILDFSKSSWQFPERAAWVLDWDPEDLEVPVLGGMRLYLNKAHPRVQQMLERPREPEVRLFQAAMQYDVARMLIRGALLSEAFFSNEGRWPSDSVGRTISLLLKSFDGDSPETLRVLMQNDSPQFEARLQHQLGLFQEL